MDNNLNNNTDNNVNVENVIPNASDANPVVPTPINAQSIQPTVSSVSDVVTENVVSSVVSASPQSVATQPAAVTEIPSVGTEISTANVSQTVAPSATVNPTVPNTGNNNDAVQNAYYKKIYII